MHAHQYTNVRTATGILGATIALSAAANVAATWGVWPWVVGGLAATAAVPMAVHLWPHIRPTDGPWWAGPVRMLATTGIVLTAAAVTMFHLVHLLGPHWTTWAVGGSIELLGVLAAMARADHSAPEVDHSAPEVDHSAPEVDHSAPEVDHSAPEVDHSAPVVDHSAPVVDHSAPVVDHSAPVVDHDAVTRIVAHLREADRAGDPRPSQRSTAIALGLSKTTVGRHWPAAVDRIDREVAS